MRLSLGALIGASCRACSWRATAEAPLSGLVIILQRNHQAFHRPQQSERDNQDQRKPQNGVDPIWRVVNGFRDQGRADDDKSGQKHDENGRPIAGIGKAIVEPAKFAAGTQGQKSRKQLSPAAMRTAAAQSCFDSGDRLLGHVEHLQWISFGLKHLAPVPTKAEIQQEHVCASVRPTGFLLS